MFIDDPSRRIGSIHQNSSCCVGVTGKPVIDILTGEEVSDTLQRRGVMYARVALQTVLFSDVQARYLTPHPLVNYPNQPFSCCSMWKLMRRLPKACNGYISSKLLSFTIVNLSLSTCR